MKLCRDLDIRDLVTLIQPYGLKPRVINDYHTIPGSFWGEPEAGLISNSLFYRSDTPVHSVLHEASHYICMESSRRQQLHTNAGGSNLEESSVCYLQIILADCCRGLDVHSLMQDMDTWGYSFRLGSTRAWFEQDAEDAIEWLLENELIDTSHSGLHQPTWRLRGA